jgi:butyryl-CoA dehydrogenase
MKEFAGRVAAITGAGSGIGRALAENLAGRGCHLALSDIDPLGLTETVHRCERSGVHVTSEQVDVANRTSVYSWADHVVEAHGRVNLIFNNAGVSLVATVEAMSYEDFEWLMNINFWGVVYGTKAFLPHLKMSGEVHVVNISSVFGLISIPSQSAYNSAKFAIRGFTDALRMEFEIEGSVVSATTVHPGGVKTNIASRARLPTQMGGALEELGPTFERWALTSPQRAATRILAAVERNRRRVLIGPDARVIDLLSRGPIQAYQRALVRGAARRFRRDGSAGQTS